MKSKNEKLNRLILELDQLLWDNKRGKVPQWLIDEVKQEIKEVTNASN